MNEKKNISFNCPLPINGYEKITLAHGGGGKLMNDLIDKMFMSGFKNELLNKKHDSTVFEINGLRLAMTTDSYVVSPIFFPGGNIGTLAINGTVNDLAMSGARPLYLTAGVILEEGFSIEKLQRIVISMDKAAKYADVKIITGDTKVVDKGKGDGIFINTAGIGVIEHSLDISPKSIEPGDAILLNGDIGRHGIAILSAREGLEFETNLLSDTAPLHNIVLELIENGIEVHCMRDLTRGGLVSALNEINMVNRLEIEIYEEKVPLEESVKGACELLGFDPLYVANEGRMIVFVRDEDKDKALEIMRKHSEGRYASFIGRVLDRKTNKVCLNTVSGTRRILDMLTGEQLPRIC